MSHRVKLHHAKICAALLLTVIVLFALPALAFAGGYNDSGYNYTDDGDSGEPGGNSGLYVRDPQVAEHIRSYQGPHGGYATTTQKCRDCHAVHIAKGAFMLMRADSRINACDFCHSGGGGSSINIQMDNAYDADGVIGANSDGSGTGHTLGYGGLSPVDVKPAYYDPMGLVCFDCHTPHAASQRVLTTFANPGRELGGEMVSAIYSGTTLATMTLDPLGIDMSLYNGGVGSFWGISVDAGNIVSVLNGTITSHPIFPTGRFLLIKDPHNTTAEMAADTVTGALPGSIGQLGYNKIEIDWDNPMGPADSTDTGDQNAVNGGSYYGSVGLLNVSEFCTDCHDGAAGASTQQAVVWYRDASNPTTGTYIDAYAHDSQPRSYLRQMILEPGGTPHNPDGTDDNFGPTCRECHIGGSSCDQCHGLDGSGEANPAYQAYTPVAVTDSPLPAIGSSVYWAQSFINKSAVPELNSMCIDGGFSWPHRTLGINLLGDELYGVDFDGTPIEAGEVRMDPDTMLAGYLDDQRYESEPATGTWKPFDDPTPGIAGMEADNLDAICLTCHGDATYWNGDDPAYEVAAPSSGWDLVLKGLP